MEASQEKSMNPVNPRAWGKPHNFQTPPDPVSKEMQVSE